MIVNRNDFHRTQNVDLWSWYANTCSLLHMTQMEVNLATRLIEKRRQYYKDGSDCIRLQEQI